MLLTVDAVWHNVGAGAASGKSAEAVSPARSRVLAEVPDVWELEAYR